MIVPEGMTVHVGRRAYPAGAMIPDDLAKAAGLTASGTATKAAKDKSAAAEDGSST